MKPKDLNLWHIPIGMLFAVVFLALLMCSCKTVEYVPVIGQRTDTLVQKVIERDSIHVHDSTIVREAGDTVLIERWHTQYRDRWHHDSIYISKTDSVPVPYPVTEYVQKPLRWHEKALIWIGILSLMAGIFACARWVSRHRLL